MEKCCDKPRIRTFASHGRGTCTDGCDNCGKEVETYGPELGQAVFGNPTGPIDFDKMPDSHVAEYMLRTLAHFATGDTSYAGEFDNDVFEMHSYYWGDCTCGYDERENGWCRTHDHAETCYQTEYHKTIAPMPLGSPGRDKKAMALCLKYGIPWDNGVGSAVHCTCAYEAEWKVFTAEHGHAPVCRGMVPNFRHKESGLEIRWYKYIGRGMSVNQHTCANCFVVIFAECLDSLRECR